MLMVKKLLLSRMLFIFTLFCREGSNGGEKNPKLKKGICIVFIGCTTSFIEPIPENILEYQYNYSRHPLPKSK